MPQQLAHADETAGPGRLPGHHADQLRLVDAMPQIVWTSRPDGARDSCNRRWFEYTGLTFGASVGRGWEQAVHPDDLAACAERWSRSARTGEPHEIEYRLRRHDGVYRWHLDRAVPTRDDQDRIVGWIGTATDIDDRKRAETRLRLLDQVSRELASSLDYEETLAAVARLAVPAIADWCTVDLLDDTGAVQLVAVAHVDPDRVRLAEQFRRRHPVDLAAPFGLPAVLRTGRPELTAAIADELLVAVAAGDDELLRLARELGLRASMCVPLVTAGRIVGGLTFVSAESGRSFGPADLALAEDLAGRAAVAIENARLHRSVARLEWAVDAALDGVQMIDPQDLRFTYASQGALDQLGYARDELESLAVHEVARDLDEGAFRTVVAPLIQGSIQSRRIVARLRRRDGTEFPAEMVLQYAPLLPEGGRLVAVVRDVTEQMEIRVRLERLARSERMRAAEVDAVLRAMGDAVLVVEADGAVSLSNPAARSLLGEASVTDYGALAGLFDDPEHRLPPAGGSARRAPVELHLKGPPPRLVEVAGYPIVVDWPAGEPAPGAPQTLLVMRDVTEARAAGIMQEAFIGVLSHELRTPVTTIYGASKVLARGEERLSEATRRDVHHDIEAEADRLYRLVEDLLVLARFDGQRLTLGDEPVLLQRLVPGVVASEKARWPSARLRLEAPPGLPTVRADPTYTEQVLRNLLTNAAKYGPPGAEIRIVLEGSGDEVLVRVLDEGPGFPAEKADLLFDLFYRSPLTAGAAGGAGIGLFVCRRLVQAMGGRIWAANRPEGGAEFGFSLRTLVEDEA